MLIIISFLRSITGIRVSFTSFSRITSVLWPIANHQLVHDQKGSLAISPVLQHLGNFSALLSRALLAKSFKNCTPFDLFLLASQITFSFSFQKRNLDSDWHGFQLGVRQNQHGGGWEHVCPIYHQLDELFQ